MVDFRAFDALIDAGCHGVGRVVMDLAPGHTTREASGPGSTVWIRRVPADTPLRFAHGAAPPCDEKART